MVLRTILFAVAATAATTTISNAHHAPPPAPQRYAQCKPYFQVSRKGYSRDEGKIAARNAWRKGVEKRYGTRFTDWKYAAHNRTKCKRINVTIQRPGDKKLPNRFICRAFAYPCATFPTWEE